LNIVVENSGYGLDNLGDVAMLQMAVKRLKKNWPDATVFVITSVPERLSTLIPDAELLPVEERQAWQSTFNLVGGVQHLFPSRAKKWLADQEARFRCCYPDSALKIIARRFGEHTEKYTLCAKFVERIRQADLVIATGGGYITDGFLSHALSVLDVLRLAQRLGRSTAMVGQGIGPATNSRLLKLFKQVCSNLLLLSQREALLSPEIVRLAAGTSPKTDLIVTGDDAVEMAYIRRPVGLGNKLGVNIRFTGYAGVSEDSLFKAGKVIHKFINSYQTEYEAIPISLIKGRSDIEAVKLMLGEKYIAENEFDNNLSVESVINSVGCCRVVITGSYHAGVFALSQGVQVVALTASKYYDSKFSGLADQFSHGLQLVHLEDDNVEEALGDALSTAWQQADKEREPLLKAAVQQVSKGKQAYQRLKELVDG